MGIRYASDAKKAAKSDVPAAYTVTVEGKTFNVQVKEGGVITADLNSQVVEGGKAAPAKSAGSGEGTPVAAPMPGTIIRVEVSAGDAVEAGQVVAVIEAMKMETEIKAANAGTVAEVLVGPKEVVTAGQAIMTIK